MAPLHRSTASATAPAPQADQLQIQHFIHQHPLNKLYMEFKFNCDGCKTGGHGVRYRCSDCNFDLHEQCATSPYHLSSQIHPHQLILVNRHGTSHFCDVCKGFTDGLSYTCQTCGTFDVHIHCIQTPVATGVPKLTLDPSQQQGGVPWTQPTAAFGGYQGVNHAQPMMTNPPQQQQQGIPATAFGGYYGANDSKPVMINHQQYQQQQQGTPVFGGGYNGMNNNQGVMINHQQYQQQQGVPMTAFGGYHTQPVMIHQQQQQGKTNNYAKVGKFAASVLMTSLIGVPVNFNSKK